MAIQGQKSKSKDIPLEIQIADDGNSLTRLSFDYRLIKPKFDEFWDFNKDRFVANYNPRVRKTKGGKPDYKTARKVLETSLGIDSMYHQVLYEFVFENLKDVLLVDDVAFAKYSDNSADILTKVCYFPAVSLKNEINMEVDMKEFTVYSDDELLKSVKEKIIAKHAENIDYDGRIDDNCIVYMAAHTNIVGEKETNNSGTTFSPRWILMKNKSMPESMYSAVIGRVGKGKFTFVTKMEDASFDTTVHILDYKKVVYPEWNDDLAKKEGFPNLDEMMKAVLEKHHANMENSKRNYVINKIITGIVTSMEHAEIPEEWIIKKTSDMVSGHVGQFRGNVDDAAKAVGVNSQTEMFDLFRSQSIRELVGFMAVREYAKKHSLPMEASNCKLVYDHMVENARIVS